jgi:PTH2 family peptidyl-tRNA hydrolase
MKQVIIIRKDLKMRRGKEIAQGSHASMAFLLRDVLEPIHYTSTYEAKGKFIANMVSEVDKWLDMGQTKICLQIHSEEELLKLHKKAEEMGLRSNYITDAGRTEFNGVPTITSLAIGPNKSEDIDKITGHLKLY